MGDGSSGCLYCVESWSNRAAICKPRRLESWGAKPGTDREDFAMPSESSEQPQRPQPPQRPVVPPVVPPIATPVVTTPVVVAPRRCCFCNLLSFVLLLNRLSLGLFFLLAGVGKFRVGTEKFYQEIFTGLKPHWLPENYASLFGHGLPYAETVLGVLLILGLLSRMTAGLMALLILAFSIAVWQAGHFFDAPGPFHFNAVYFTLALLLMVTGPGGISIDAACRRKSCNHTVHHI